VIELIKRRLSKKLIKRYIHPLIKNLKTIDHFDENYTNCTIINGEVIPEGCRYTSMPFIKAIRDTSELIRKTLLENSVCLLRIYPEVRYGAIRVRLLLEK